MYILSEVIEFEVTRTCLRCQQVGLLRGNVLLIERGSNRTNSLLQIKRQFPKSGRSTADGFYEI